MESWRTVSTLLLFLLLPVVAGNRCYVCVPRSGSWRDDALSMFPGPPELLLCEHFHPRDKRYERDCPPQHTGCLTQSRGQEVLRTCTERAGVLNDCKVANDVYYCFCSGSDLCNGNISRQELSKEPSHPMPQPPVDDEDQDFQEGSGVGAFSTAKSIISPTTVHPPHGTTTRSVSEPAGNTAAGRTLGWLSLIVAVVIAVQ
ncbi:uncharacterized protein [Periplaneta americana]|uniref:uncharacterized protein isoform X2 n=1 Tax=Periplaneta americana TaxID=6978 RepID=UPI0037E709F4